MNMKAGKREERTPSRQVMLRRRLLPVLVAGCFGTALANPLGPQVVNGQASIVTQGNVLSVTNTPGTIINWQSFSINPGELTRFIQQAPDSAVLNRIVGQDPSQILGALQSNGRVFLINPNGILFGQGAQVDVNGLVASTLNLSNEDFLKGRLDFKAGDKAGNLKNQGVITTPAGGQVLLIAPNVENSGIITSPKGDVMLAAGHSVQLVDSLNPDLRVVVSAPEHEALNLGQVIAQGGRTGIYGALVKQRGIVNADSAAVGENGKVVLKASRDTLLEAGSRTTARGAGRGGEIQVLGERVGLTGDAQVDASGQQGGGTVLVGGDYQGKNPEIQNAKVTYVGKDAAIKADAIDNGDGGKVIVWADDTARYYGTISARGGQHAGDGGFVETSGKQRLAFNGRVDTSAHNGRAGMLLLDPLDISIVSGGTGANDNLLGDNQILADEPDTTTSVTIAEQTLEALSGNVTLSASRDVILGDLSDGELNLANVGSGSTFTISAARHITATADVNDRFRTAGGNIVFTTTNGDINIGGVKSGGGTVSLTAGGSGNAVIREVVTTPGGGNGGNISITSGGYMTLGGGHVDARGSGTAGNVTLNSGGAISMQTGKTIYGNQLKMTAASGIYGTSSADYMSTQVSALNARNTTSSLIKVSNAGGNLSIADIGTVGYGVKNDASGGQVDITTSTGYSLDISAKVSSVNGAISLTGAGGINLYASSAPEIVSSGGTISLYASDASAKISTASGTQISSFNGTVGNTVALQADKMQLLGTINADTAKVKLAPLAGTAIHLGTGTSDTTNGTLELANSELSNITAGTLVVGAVGGGASGAIDIKSNLSTGFSAMSLLSGSTVTQQSGATLGGALSFNIQGSSVTLLEANPTGVIAGAASSGDFKYHSQNGIAVSTVDGTAGITVPGTNNIYLESDNTSASAINQSSLLSGGGLALKTKGSISLNNASNSVGKLAADLDPDGLGTGALVFRNSGAFATDAVAGISNIVTRNKEVVLKSDSGAVTVTGTINAGSGNVSVSGTGLTVNGAITGSDVELEGDTLSLGATVTATMAGIHTRSSGRTITVGAACGGCLSVTNLHRINAGTIGIGRTSGTLPGNITVSGITVGGTGLTDRNANTTRIGLLTGGSVSQTASTTINVHDLGVVAGAAVNLSEANSVVNFAGSTTSGALTFNNAGSFYVSTLSGGSSANNNSYSLSGVSTAPGGGNILLASSSGSITFDANSPIAAGSGNVTLSAGLGAITGPTSSVVSGARLTATSASGTSLKSQVGILEIDNTGLSGDIAVTNTGSLTLYDVKQSNTGASTGSISITNAGAISQPAGKVLSAKAGGINVLAKSPLTIDGTVATTSGPITLEAGTGSSPHDILTINGTVSSGNGNITLLAGDAIVGTATTSGTLTIQANRNAASGGGSTAPTVDQCTADPSLSGCSTVLPSLSTCTTAPATAGCSVVLPKLDTCVSAPATAGCSVVLPTVDACTTDPGKAGCSVVLPKLDTCVSAPATAGCSVVLPKLDACTADPGKAGCSVVLPKLDTCVSAPATAGCSVVLPTVDACTADPGKAGCSVVLPKLDTCVSAPATAGCSVVLPKLDTCISAPTTAGCSAVLPTMSSCTSDPAQAGCSVVLPTLAQCSATPALEGCSAVVPAASKCVINPTAAECQAVLPGKDPAKTTAAITETVTETTNTVVNANTSVQASMTRVQAGSGSSSGGASSRPAEQSSDSKGEDRKDDKKTTSTADDSGAKKNEPAKKMYCN
jgi:filamentous hemagglutinin family protein